MKVEPAAIYKIIQGQKTQLRKPAYLNDQIMLPERSMGIARVRTWKRYTRYRVGRSYAVQLSGGSCGIRYAYHEGAIVTSFDPKAIEAMTQAEFDRCAQPLRILLQQIDYQADVRLLNDEDANAEACFPEVFRANHEPHYVIGNREWFFHDWLKAYDKEGWSLWRQSNQTLNVIEGFVADRPSKFYRAWVLHIKAVS